MNCPNCSTDVAPNALFCHRCGVSLTEDDTGAAESSGHAPAFKGRPGSDVSKPFDDRDQPRDRFSPAGFRGRNDDDNDDEEIELWQGHFSPKAMLSAWIGAGLLSLVAIVATFLFPVVWPFLAGLIALGWIALVLYLVYMHFNYSYRLTSQRFIHERGILRRLTNRVEVIDIDDVEFEQGLVDRFVGVGTIRITSSDRSHAELVVRGIANVKHVAGVIYNARRKERIERGLHIEAV